MNKGSNHEELAQSMNLNKQDMNKGQQIYYTEEEMNLMADRIEKNLTGESSNQNKNIILPKIPLDNLMNNFEKEISELQIGQNIIPECHILNNNALNFNLEKRMSSSISPLDSMRNNQQRIFEFENSEDETHQNEEIITINQKNYRQDYSEKQQIFQPFEDNQIVTNNQDQYLIKDEKLYSQIDQNKEQSGLSPIGLQVQNSDSQIRANVKNDKSSQWNYPQEGQFKNQFPIQEQNQQSFMKRQQLPIRQTQSLPNNSIQISSMSQTQDVQNLLQLSQQDVII